jgi:putative hydrolase of the HAD superfamily
VIDLDDTLFLETEYVRSGFDAVSQFVHDRYGIEGFGVRCWELFSAGVRGNVFQLAAESRGWSANESSIRSLVNVYRDHEPNIALTVDRRHSLRTLAENFRLAVLTGGDPMAQRHKAAAVGVDDWATTVVFAGERGAAFDKPHQWAWLELEQRMESGGGRIVYVADNPLKDLPASIALGWGFIRVRMSDSLHEAQPTPEGIAEIADFAFITPDLARLVGDST